MAKDIFEIQEVPDAITRDKMRVEATKADLDLPERDRSSRAVVLTIRGQELFVGDIVTLIDGSEMEVIAPGRGANMAQGAWLEGRVSCRCTFSASQIVSVRRP